METTMLSQLTKGAEFRFKGHDAIFAVTEEATCRDGEVSVMHLGRGTSYDVEGFRPVEPYLRSD